MCQAQSNKKQSQIVKDRLHLKGLLQRWELGEEGTIAIGGGVWCNRENSLIRSASVSRVT